MSEDSFTEITNQSWGSRIGNSIKGILIGIILFVAAFPLLFWNEGRTVKRYKTLKEGAGAVITVSADKVDTNNEGKLVHITGRAATDEILSDIVFGISINAIKLKRMVQMFQWNETSKTETQKKTGGGTTSKTTYSYNKGWSENLISSSDFKKPEGHENPVSMPYNSSEMTAGNVTLGAFRLSDSLVGRINNYSQLDVGPDAKLPEDIKNKAKVSGGGLYFGADPMNPVIGDTKVSFKSVPPSDISVVAQQVSDTFNPYQAKSGGGTIELLQIGTHSSANMFTAAQKENQMIAWLLRGGGFFMMFFGLTLVLKPLSVFADVLPILGNIVGAGTGFVAFLIAGALSLITIAVAWIAYRPILGGILLAAALTLLVASTKVSKSKGRQGA